MTHSFTDTEGRVWELPKLTLGHIMRLNEKINIQLDDLLKEGHLWNSDDNALIAVGASLWCLLSDKANGVSESQFFEAFDGDVFEAAQKELAKAVVNFSPPHLREALRKKLKTMQLAAVEGARIQAKQAELLETVIADGEEALLAKVVAAIRDELGEQETRKLIDVALSNGASKSQENPESETREAILSES